VGRYRFAQGAGLKASLLRDKSSAESTVQKGPHKEQGEHNEMNKTNS